MVASQIPTTAAMPLSLEGWVQNPVDRTEWVDGQLVEKAGMTLKHSRVQAELSSNWRTYKNTVEPGGEVYTEVPCRTNQQGRSPDVAYLTPALVAQYGNAKVLPQAFPLIAEIVSPTDFAEEMIAKAQEYLVSGCEEVWLVYPEVRWIVVMTIDSRQVFATGEVARTQKVLPGFSVAIDELLA